MLTPPTAASPALQAAERQGGELVEAQRMVAALEAELEGKAREGAALLADTLELKVGAGRSRRERGLERRDLDEPVVEHRKRRSAVCCPAWNQPGEMKCTRAAPAVHAPSVHTSPTRSLQRRLQDAQDGLHNATDGHAAEATALAGRLKEVERTLAASQADGKMALAAAATADAATADAKRALAQRADALAAEQQARATLAEQAAALQAELSVAQRQRGELTAAAQELQARLEAAAKQAEARVATEGEARQRAEAATAAAREALADERQRHALEAAAWERRLREAQEGGAARLAAREAAWEAERGKAVKEAAAGEEETRRTLTKRLYLAEGEWAKKLQHASTEWAARLDGLGAEWAARAEADKAAWAAERARLAEEMEARLAEAEAAQEAAVDEARQRGRRKLAATEARAAEAAVAADRCVCGGGARCRQLSLPDGRLHSKPCLNLRRSTLTPPHPWPPCFLLHQGCGTTPGGRAGSGGNCAYGGSGQPGRCCSPARAGAHRPAGCGAGERCRTAGGAGQAVGAQAGGGRGARAAGG